MKSLRIFALLSVLAVGGVAQAQEAPVPISPNDVVNPNALVEGAGVKVGEGTVLHPIIGVETGVVQNVFYEEAGTNTAGLLRLLFEISAGSLPKERLTVPNQDEEQKKNLGSFMYDLRAYATWDQYLSGNDRVTSQGGLGGGLVFRGIARPSDPLNFSFLEFFNRMVRATNFESAQDTNRDINTIQLRLAYQPRGRSIGGYLYYQNVIDVFEADTQAFANRFQNTFGLRFNWQWLPLTRVYTDVSMGVFSGLGSDSTKVDSYPLTAVLGVMTSLTVNTTLNARVGYTNGFYSEGASYSTVTGGVQFGYRYSPLGRITALYSYDHADSINSNFYRDHHVQLALEQLFVPFAIVIRPELYVRRYNDVPVMSVDGETVRDDLIAQITVGARYSFRNWLATTIDYSFTTVQTDFRYTDASGSFIDDPSFTRHTLLAGLRAAY
jgi:hypothetical protein